MQGYSKGTGWQSGGKCRIESNEVKQRDTVKKVEIKKEVKREKEVTDKGEKQTKQRNERECDSCFMNSLNYTRGILRSNSTHNY